MRLPFSVQVFLASKQDAVWSVLVLQRNARPELGLPDFWQGITGALEPGESFEAAAVREVHEETSIRIPLALHTGFEQRFPIKLEWRAVYGPEPTHVHEKVLYAIVSERIGPALSAEHKAYRWCTEQESVSLLSFGNNRRCVQAVFRVLGESGA